MADLPPRQIVRLTRCLDVRGHPATLIEMMSYVGYRWYPEYTVEEQFHDFNQTQYHCIVKIYPHHNGVTQPIHFGHGIGMTENMAVQDAAYSCITLLREEHTMLRETSFRYIPAALPGEEGYYTGLYSDHSTEDPALQMTARFASDRDRDARALRFELHSTRARLYMRQDDRFRYACNIGDLSIMLVETKKHVLYHLVYLIIKLILILPVATTSNIGDMRQDDRFRYASNIGDLIMLVETKKHVLYHLVYLLIKLILVLPVATTSVERVFSAMNLVKSKLRTTMSDDRLNDCLVTFIEQDVFLKVSEEDIVDAFMAMQQRRVT